MIYFSIDDSRQLGLVRSDDRGNDQEVSYAQLRLPHRVI